MKNERRRTHVRVVLLCACLAAAAGCGDDPGAAIPPGYARVTGSERLGWDQRAANTQELSTFRYRVHVDDTAGTALEGVTCGATAGPAGFSCTGRLPSMSPGPHTLTLSAYVEIGGERLESERSAGLNVFFAAGASSLMFPATTSLPKTLRFPATAASSSQATSSLTMRTLDGVDLHAEVVSGDLEEPTDLAFAPDGGIFIAERAGRVRVFRAGRLAPVPALTLSDVTTTDGQGLLALAVDRQFERTGFVYLVYTTPLGFRLARFRAVGDTLADRAILLDGLPFSSFRPAATVRFGLDDRLYLGLDAAGDPRNAGDLGSFNGKILRLNPDATTPADQAGSSPVYAPNIGAPRGADWDAGGATLWIADEMGDGSGQLQVIEAVGESERRNRSGKTVARYALPDGALAAGLAFYRGDHFPAFRGNLLVAADGPTGEAGIMRLLFDPADSRVVVRTERLLRGSIDGASAIGVSPDGVIYLCTRTALLALTPGR